MQRKAAMEYQFRLGRAEGLRPRPRDKCVIRKRMWTLARKAGRAHCRSSPLLLLFQIQPQPHPQLCGRSRATASPIFGGTLFTPYSLPLLIAVSQTPAPGGIAQEPTGQSSPGSIQVNFRYSPLPQLPQHQSPSLIPSSVRDHPLQSPSLAQLPGPHRSTPSNFFPPIYYFISAPSSNRHFLGACRPLEAQVKQKGNYRSSALLHSSQSNPQVSFSDLEQATC